MSAVTKITKRALPDHDGTPIEVIDDWCHIGTLIFEKATSRFTDAPGQLPHRPWPLKKKHRAR